MKMTEEHVASFCLSLPGAREDYKWGGARLFDCRKQDVCPAEPAR